MELESLFTSSKWELLQHLSQEPLSPLELSQRTSTSLANISQQLRLLEMAGLVTSSRIPNRDKGQPRIKYRLAQDHGYVITAASDFAEKRLVPLTSHNKAVLRIWFYENPDVRYALEKAFWTLDLARIDTLAVHAISGNAITLCVTGEACPDDLEILTLNGKTVHLSFQRKERPCADDHVIFD